MTTTQLNKLVKAGKIRDYKVVSEVKKPVKSKYGNKRVEYDGIKFDSTKERDRYVRLKLMEKHGYLKNLRRQVEYELNAGGTHSLKYVADFVYEQAGITYVEDVKPLDKKSGEFRLTQTFKRKMKLMKDILGIEIKLV